MTRKELQAMDKKNKSCNCCQQVLVTFSEDYGLSREDASRMANAMGGGFRIGEICGALVAGCAVVGLKHGAPNPDDAEAKAYCDMKAEEFAERFRQEFGCVTCRDMLGVSDGYYGPSHTAEDRDNFDKKCVEVIKTTARLLEEMGY